MHGSKKGRQRPEKGAKARADPLPKEKDRTVTGARTLPFSRAREKAAAAASASSPTLEIAEGSTLTSDPVVTPPPVKVATPPQARGEAGGHTDVGRRKPSQERVSEPRAVFLHRASIVPPSTDAPAAGEAAKIAGSVAGEEAGVIHQRRQSVKGRVGSVLST